MGSTPTKDLVKLRLVLEGAGVANADIQQLEEALTAYQSAKARSEHKTPQVVCTGVYNTGKSTLLNTLLGEDERFPTGDIPTTKVLARAEADGVVYIDTPGLNAAEEDDQETQSAYESADFILFVSNAQSGGVSEAEARWLQHLEKRYTADSLKKRLIYVLTHCGQVEPEQLPDIERKFRSDLEKAIGFVPEQIFCVDSILYQQGREQGEPILVEVSGVSGLHEYLKGWISDIDKLLMEAQNLEIETQRKAALEEINRCIMYCKEKMGEKLAQNLTKDWKSVFAEAKENLKKQTSSTVILRGTGRTYRGTGETFEGKDGYSLKRQARDYVRTFAADSVNDVRYSIEDIVQRAQEAYGNTGVDSEYFKCSNAVNQLLEELYLNLVQCGIQVDAPEAIDVTPNVSRIESILNEILIGGDYWSANMYLEVFENRIEFNKYDNWYEERGLFGIVKSKPKYVIYTYNAIYEIDKHISKIYMGQLERAKRRLNSYWESFLEKLYKEADDRIKILWENTQKQIASAQEKETIPYQSALNMLSEIEKEVRK